MIKQDTPFKLTTYLNKRFEVIDKPGYYVVWIQVYPYDKSFNRFYVTTNISATVDQYDNMFNVARTKLKPNNTDKLNAIVKMIDKAEALNDFKICRSPQAFKDKWKGTKNNEVSAHGYTNNLNDCFDAKISELDDNEQWGTLETYKNTRKALKNYFKEDKFMKLSLYELTPIELNRYEKYHLEKGNKIPSLDFRNLRALWNKAMSHNQVDVDAYPFGKQKFIIKRSKAVHKALSLEQLEQFSNYDPKTPSRIKAKEIWFLSMLCGGINLKDLCYLRHDKVFKDHVVFTRGKTKNQPIQKEIRMPRSEHLNMMLKKYKGAGKYALNILDHRLSSYDTFKCYENRKRGFDKKFAIFSKKLGFELKISVYKARHSFATQSRNDGQDINKISQAMGHKTMEQTQSYFAQYMNDDMKGLQDNMSRFIKK